MGNPIVLSGVDETFLNGEDHFGISIEVESGGNASSLVIPDVKGVKEKTPIFISKPIKITGKDLIAFLQSKDIKIPENFSIVEKSSVSCQAFYYTKEGPRLMMFQVSFNETDADGKKDELFSSLTGDPHLKNLFKVNHISLRYIKCDPGDIKKLEAYAATLQE